MSDHHDLTIHEKPITAGVILQRNPDGIETNVPHRVILHSPTGYEWGYGGSGPADLALNILENALIALGHHGPRHECWHGDCFQLAWFLHQAFKWDIISPMPYDGGVICWDDLRAWLVDRCAKMKFCMNCGLPTDECNCGEAL